MTIFYGAVISDNQFPIQVDREWARAPVVYAVMKYSLLLFIFSIWRRYMKKGGPGQMTFMEDD